MKNFTHYLKIIFISFIVFILKINVFGAVGLDSFAIHSLGHASLYFEYKNLIIHVDPYSSQANYSLLPDADLILITHDHPDHYDLAALSLIKKDSTLLITTQAVKDIGTYSGTINVMKNGDSIVVDSIPIKAVPAYNKVSSTIYHPKGRGNGYVLTLGEKRIYIAGDTENIPEMDSLGKIDIAFLPMNLPYTMTVTMAVDAAKRIMPDILYIYHFGNSDTASLRSQLSDQKMKIRMGKSVFYESDKKIVTRIREALPSNTTFFYPNPVEDYIILNNAYVGSTLSVFDMKGILILKEKINSENQSFNLKHLNKGLYIVTYQNDFDTMTKLLYKK